MNHHHEFSNEKKTLSVIVVSIITMVLEILFGFITGSMALLADGFHMGTHVLALGLTLVSYILIRKFKNSKSFPKGTDKIGDLAAYTSSLFLGLTGLSVIYESALRLFNPQNIEFNEAIFVAFVGLIVNVICIFIMEYKEIKGEHTYDKHHLQHEDFNFKAAYFHILTDALTSVLAIIALLVGKYFNLTYFDALIGILGGILIIRWAFLLIKDTMLKLIDFKKE